jgi:hypothetical protein
LVWAGEASWAGCGVHVDDLLSGQQFSDPDGADTVLTFEPTFVLLLVLGDDLLRYAVDVLEEGGDKSLQDGNSGRWRDVGHPYGIEYEFAHAALPEPVGPHERVHGDVVLCQPPGVFQSGVWRLDTFHRDVVAQGRQDGIDVAFGAGAKKLRREGIPAHLRHRVFDVKHDVRS